MDWNTAKDTEIPKTVGNYMKFDQGANKFRILSEPIMGWEYWTEAKGKEKGKPVRSTERPSVIPLDADLRNGWNPRYFWAFVVWNLDAKKLQILEITQSTILTPLQQLVQNEDWGDPRKYSITINRKGEGLDSEYNLTPSPAKETSKEIVAQYENAGIRLELLYEGKDPFDTKAESAPKEDFPAEYKSGTDVPNPDDISF